MESLSFNSPTDQAKYDSGNRTMYHKYVTRREVYAPHSILTNIQKVNKHIRITISSMQPQKASKLKRLCGFMEHRQERFVTLEDLPL